MNSDKIRKRKRATARDMRSLDTGIEVDGGRRYSLVACLRHSTNYYSSLSRQVNMVGGGGGERGREETRVR